MLDKANKTHTIDQIDKMCHIDSADRTGIIDTLDRWMDRQMDAEDKAGYGRIILDMVGQDRIRQQKAGVIGDGYRYRYR